MSVNYSEPSQSTVVLPDPPAWVNLDVIVSYDARERIKDLIEEGRELLVKAAEWGREAVPLTIHEWPGLDGGFGGTSDAISPILDRVCGIEEIEELTYLFTIAAGHRYDIDNDRAKRARDEHPELGLHEVENDDPPSDNPLADACSFLLHMGYAIFTRDGIPAHGAGIDPEYADLNDLSERNARQVLDAIYERSSLR